MTDGAVAAIRRALPRGRTLPDGVWSRRHRAILGLLWAHAVFVPVYALIQGASLSHAAVEALILPVTALIAGTTNLPRRVRTVAASLGLLSASAILVHLSGGLIEMHFHFFVMVAVVALYQDWTPFLMSIGYVLIHHGLIGVLEPRSVYNHPAAIANPWRWAAVHALFIAGISVACIVTWRLNELHFAQQQAAEERLREETRIVETLNEVGKTLAAELDLQQVVQHVTDAATELTGASYGAFFYNVVQASGESYMLYTISGCDRDAFSKFPMPRNTPMFAPTFQGEGTVRIDDVLADHRYGKMPPYHGMPPGHLPVRSYLAVPVRSRFGRVIGGLFFAHAEPGRFDEVAERLANGIAAHAAIAIDNAGLYDSERTAREAAEEARARLQVLAEATRALSSSLEVEGLMRGFASAIAPAIADDCVVYLVEHGAIKLVAFSVDPQLEQEWAGVAPPQPDPGNIDDPIGRAVRTIRPVVIEEYDDEMFARGIPDPALRERVARFRPTSSIVVPLVHRGEVLGALALGTNVLSERRLRGSDLPLVEELGKRAAIAIDNARLYAAQRSAAETLQHSLLPERLPSIPGLELRARYVPGGPGSEIGGDWYDVIVLPSGRIGFAMGDVVGRGVAAASLMGQLRNALRAYVLDGAAPADTLERLNRLLFTAGTEADPMATLLYGELDPDTGALRIASAGHPPPLAVLADRSTSFLDGSGGVPLGVLPAARYSETTSILEPGATLVLYTDGLVEDRTSPLETGLERLRATSSAAPADLDALCDALLERVPSQRDDDVAILAVHAMPLDDRLELRLPASPEVLAPLRATLRRWLSARGAAEDEIFEVCVAACEACSNAIQHASPGIQEFEFIAEMDGAVHLTVRDRGTWREPQQTLGGRGLGIIEQLMGSLEVERSPEGTVVRMSRELAVRTEVPT